MKILAIGVHPDDIELGCSGTLIKHALAGDEVNLVDLTQGELGSRGTIETRYHEAETARKIIGAHRRVNLRMRDGFFTNSEEEKIALIKYIRYFQPDIIIGNAIHDRHPDHGRAHQLIYDACFLSGLVKIKTTCPETDIKQEAWRPKMVLSYIQDKYIEPNIIVDITDVFEQKIESIRAYATQFAQENPEDGPSTYISRPEFLEQIIGRAREWGHKIGVKYGEGLTTDAFLGLKNLHGLHLPGIS